MYNTMIKSGVYTTKAEGKFEYTLENDKVDFDYVTVPFFLLLMMIKLKLLMLKSLIS